MAQEVRVTVDELVAGFHVTQTQNLDTTRRVNHVCISLKYVCNKNKR